MDEVEVAPEEIFHDCLIGLGFAENAIEALVQEGIDTMESLLSLSTNDLKELRMHLLAEVRNRTGNAAKPRFPYVSFKKLMAMHEWGQCMTLLGREPDPATFELGVVRRWEERLQELELIAKTAIDHPEVPKFAKFDEWQLWDEKFRSHLHTQRSAVAGTPLTYVIRDEVEGAGGAEDGTADGNDDADDDHQGNIDDLLVAKRTVLQGRQQASLGDHEAIDPRRPCLVVPPEVRCTFGRKDGLPCFEGRSGRDVSVDDEKGQGISADCNGAIHWARTLQLRPVRGEAPDRSQRAGLPQGTGARGEESH
jgi:hypothetical protein